MTIEEKKKQIETKRKEKYKTQEDFADAAGLSVDTYKKFLQRGNAESDTLIRIADTLDVSVDFVLGRIKYDHVGDKEIQEQTGLSLKAITRMRSWQKEHKWLKDHPKNWTKTVNTLIESDNSFLDELYYYLRVFPSDVHLSVEEEIYKYDESDPDKIIDMDLVTKWIGHYQDNEVSITLDNGTSYPISEELLASAQLTRVTKSIQDLREKLWKEWKKNRNTVREK